jgi:23S rRNA pseudouridine2604 synthase
LQFHPTQLRSLVPAGRLDIDSVGLLVLTQDGRVAKQLIGQDTVDRKGIPGAREYTKPGRLPDSELRKLNHGLWMDGKPLLPAKVRWQNDDQLSFTLKEGRKRQIRRMCDMVGLKVVGLKRVRIGPRQAGRPACRAVALPGRGRRFLRRLVGTGVADTPGTRLCRVGTPCPPARVKRSSMRRA